MSGLNKWATEFVKPKRVLIYTEKTTRIYPGGRKEKLEDKQVYNDSVKVEPHKHLCDRRGDEHVLNKYTFPDGQVYFERLELLLKHPQYGFYQCFCSLEDSSSGLIPGDSCWRTKELEKELERTLTTKKIEGAKRNAEELWRQEDVYHK